MNQEAQNNVGGCQRYYLSEGSQSQKVSDTLQRTTIEENRGGLIGAWRRGIGGWVITVLCILGPSAAQIHSVFQ